MKRCRPSEKSLLGKNWVFQWGKQERKQLDRGGLRHLRAAKECANGLIGPCCSSTWSAGVTSKCCSSSGSGYIVALMPEEEENPHQPRQRHPTPACLDFHLRDRVLESWRCYSHQTSTHCSWWCWIPASRELADQVTDRWC